jgi:two-component system, NarL family, invasion response regulator UvrY
VTSGVDSTTDTTRNPGDHGRVSDDPVSVLVVDDQVAFRRAAAEVIAATDGFVLAGEVISGEDAISFLERQRAELVLLDVCMPGMGGIDTAAHIGARFPDVVVVLLSVYRIHDLPPEVLLSGAQFCHKEQFGPEELEKLWRDRTSTSE